MPEILPSPRSLDEPYEYEIRLATSFDDVLVRQGGSGVVDVTGLVEVVRRHACTVLQARGGSGKSYTAERVRALLLEQGVWSVNVPASTLLETGDIDTWGPGQWADAAGGDETGGAYSGRPGVIVVDGLNEVARDIGEKVLASVAPLTATNPQITFLVTDRLVRRPDVSRHWRYATLGQVPDEVVRRVAGTDPTPALRIPYFLQRHTRGSSASEILRDLIAQFVDSEGLRKLASAAYQSYANHKRRTLDKTVIEAAVGEPVWRAMIEAGEIVALPPAAEALGESARQESYSFDHHLLHDFLAGYHVAVHPDLWMDEAFDVVTLKASSFDALALALTQVEGGAGEDLVQRVYDWNFYAAAYMLHEDRVGGGVVSAALGTALLGALAEKKFDGVLPTEIRACDALRVNQSPIASEMLNAPDRRTVVDIVRTSAPSKAPEWFQTWLEQFDREDGAPATSDDVRLLASEQPVLGWGAANALRRFTLDAQIASDIRALLNDARATVRWRATHALGPHADRENLMALTTRLAEEDDDSWVAYGALRATLEQIRHMPSDERASLLAGFAAENRTRLARPGTLLRSEAIRCLEVDPLPPRWHRDIEPLLTALWETADDKGAADLAALAGRLRERKNEEAYA